MSLVKQALEVHTVFYQWDGGDIIFHVYVDEMIILDSNSSEIEKLSNYLVKADYSS